MRKKAQTELMWILLPIMLAVAIGISFGSSQHAKVPKVGQDPMLYGATFETVAGTQVISDSLLSHVIETTEEKVKKKNLLSEVYKCGDYLGYPILFTQEGSCLDSSFDMTDIFPTEFLQEYQKFKVRKDLPLDYSTISFNTHVTKKGGKTYLEGRAIQKIPLKLIDDKRHTLTVQFDPSFLLPVNVDVESASVVGEKAKLLYERCKDSLALESCILKATKEDKILDTEEFELVDSCEDKDTQSFHEFVDYVQSCATSPDHTCVCRNNKPKNGVFDVVKNNDKGGITISKDGSDLSYDLSDIDIIGQILDVNKDGKILLKSPEMFGGKDPLDEAPVAEDEEDDIEWPNCEYLPKKTYRFCLQDKNNKDRKQKFAIVFSPRVKLSLDASVLVKGFRIHIDADCSSSETASLLKDALLEEGADVVYHQDEDAVACEDRIIVDQLTADVKNDRQSIFLTLEGIEGSSDVPISVSYRAVGESDEISVENKLLSDAVLKAVYVDSEVQASSVGDELLYRTVVSTQLQLSSDFQSNEAVVDGIIKGLKEYGKQSYELLIENSNNVGYHLTSVDMKFDSDIGDERNFPVNRIEQLMPEDSLVQNPKEMCDVSKEEGVDCRLVAAVISKCSSFTELKRGDEQPHGVGCIYEDEVLAILNGVGVDIEEDATETAQQQIEAQIRSKNKQIDAQFNNMFRITDKARYLYATTFRSKNAEDVLMQIRFTAKKLKLVKHYLEITDKPTTTPTILQAYHDGAASIFMNGQSKKYLKGEEDSINYVKDVEELYKGFAPEYKRELGDDELGWPVEAPVVVTSCWGNRSVTSGSKEHEGTDFRASVGAPVLAAHDGFIESIKFEPWGFVALSSDDGKIKTRYIHNSVVDIKKQGDKVKRGEKIAEAGKKGTIDPHLHFEVLVNGKKIDPLEQYSQPMRGELKYKSDSNCNYWGAQDNRNKYPYVAEIGGRITYS